MAPRLDGFTVGVTADRRWEEQVELLARRGIAALHGPSIRTLPLTSGPALRVVTQQLVDNPPDYLVANTAIGMRAWFSEADSAGYGDQLIRALHHTTIVARGLKAAGAVHAVGLEVSERAASETLAEVYDLLARRSLPGARIAFQRDGGENQSCIAALRAAGAEVIEIDVYRWRLPENPAPAVRLVEAAIEGRIDAVTFTSAPAVFNLFRIAADAGLDDELRDALAGPVPVVCTGPVSAAAVHDCGIDIAVTPRHARIGPMVHAVARLLAARIRHFDVDGLEVVVRGARVDIGATRVAVTPREASLLAALVERPGVVLSKVDLLEQVWGDAAADPHVVEVTVGRLRRRLQAAGLTVQAVPRRGYRITRHP